MSLVDFYQSISKTHDVVRIHDATILDIWEYNFISVPDIIFKSEFIKFIDPFPTIKVQNFILACSDISHHFNFSYDRMPYELLITKYGTRNDFTQLYALVKHLAFNENFIRNFNLEDGPAKGITRYDTPLIAHFDKNEFNDVPFRIHPGMSRCRFMAWYFLKYNRLIKADILYFKPKEAIMQKDFFPDRRKSILSKTQYLKLWNTALSKPGTVDIIEDNGIKFLEQKWVTAEYPEILETIAYNIKHHNYERFITDRKQVPIHYSSYKNYKKFKKTLDKPSPIAYINDVGNKEDKKEDR